ncbi:hypothetical protein EC844_11860 [Acinetobacter calcoaceticus]|uniref:Outer membrane protein n=1 Tax=Acinetobacter calcoaceticus TaxID=471 RepID=A0A4R1XK75_ACICA|nr:hypothetical protein EC844_11860 [Acinetobacter calcoaceticus]
MKSYVISLISIFTFIPTAFAYANTSNVENTWEGPVKLNLNVYAFAADVDGTLRKGKIDYQVDQPFKETLKNLDSSYMLNLDLSKGRWGAYADTQVVKTSESKQLMQVPIALATDLKQSSIGLYYQAYNSAKDSNLSSNKNQRARFIVEPTIGVHRTEVDATLAALNHSSEVSTSWNEFFWGSRFKYNFDSPWNLAAELSFGAEDTRSAQAYVGYRQPIFDRAINIRLGYRYFAQNHYSNNFNWEIKQHGPVIGLNLPIF